jgi:hypothetical protein
MAESLGSGINLVKPIAEVPRFTSVSPHVILGILYRLFLWDEGWARGAGRGIGHEEFPILETRDDRDDRVFAYRKPC